MIKITPRKIAIGIVITVVIVGLVAIVVFAPPASPIVAAALAIGGIVAEEGIKVLVEKAQKKYKKWKNKGKEEDEEHHVHRYESVHLDTPYVHFSKRTYSGSDIDCSDEQLEESPIIRRKLKPGG